MNYYIATIERVDVIEDQDDYLGFHGRFLVKAEDEFEAHEKVREFLGGLCDSQEGEWYISFTEGTSQKIFSIMQVRTLCDLEEALPTID